MILRGIYLLLRRGLAVAKALGLEQVAVRAVPRVRLRADLQVAVGDVLVGVRVHHVAVLDLRRNQMS